MRRTAVASTQQGRGIRRLTSSGGLMSAVRISQAGRAQRSNVIKSTAIHFETKSAIKVRSRRTDLGERGPGGGDEKKTKTKHQQTASVVSPNPPPPPTTRKTNYVDSICACIPD